MYSFNPKENLGIFFKSSVRDLITDNGLVSTSQGTDELFANIFPLRRILVQFS